MPASKLPMMLLVLASYCWLSSAVGLAAEPATSATSFAAAVQPVWDEAEPLLTDEVGPPVCCPHGGCHGNCCPPGSICKEAWHWEILPEGLIYRSYLAGPKESRFGSVWFNEKEQGLLWDIALGGRVGLLRYGTSDGEYPEGWQLDIEGAAFPRLDPPEERDMVSADFRFGVPLTYGEGPYQTKLAYYHLSSHIGDEYLLKHPGFVRNNYSRDALVWGQSVYLSENVRLYGEIEYAFIADGGAEPWATQFGAEYSPACMNGFRGSPFAAVNAYLFEENDWGGIFTLQTGWQWRGGRSGKLLRIGLHYLSGKSPQLEFVGQHEEQIGGGIWYDY